MLNFLYVDYLGLYWKSYLVTLLTIYGYIGSVYYFIVWVRNPFKFEKIGKILFALFVFAFSMLNTFIHIEQYTVLLDISSVEIEIVGEINDIYTCHYCRHEEECRFIEVDGNRLIIEDIGSFQIGDDVEVTYLKYSKSILEIYMDD